MGGGGKIIIQLLTKDTRIDSLTVDTTLLGTIKHGVTEGEKMDYCVNKHLILM